jgi:Conjugative transposon protein TcpC
MATGNRVLPGAPVATERAVTAEQQMMAGRRTGSAGSAGYATDGYESDDLLTERPQRTARRGSGGRWLVWVGRAVVWLVLLLIGYRGILAIISSYQNPPASNSTGAGPPVSSFPVSMASGFALEFSQVYLNFSPSMAAQRATELAPFLPPGTDPKLGWNGSGSQTVQFEQVVGVDVQNDNNAIVDVLGLTGGRLIEIGVPVYYSGGGMVVSGQPAFLTPPANLIPPTAPKVTIDVRAQQALARQLPDFFRAYASGESAKLSAFAAPGVQLSGLGGEVEFGSIVSVVVPAGSGSTRNITVTVTWLPASTPSAGPPASGGRAQLQMTYAMTVIRRGGHWYVSSIGASTTLPGPST